MTHYDSCYRYGKGFIVIKMKEQRFQLPQHLFVW